MALGNNFDITINQGATFELTITWKDSAGTAINLTGYSARMQVRQKITDTAKLLDLSTGNGAITLGGAAGTISVVAPATSTDDITAKQGVYDLELESGSGVVTRLVQGCVTISPEVTRP